MSGDVPFGFTPRDPDDDGSSGSDESGGSGSVRGLGPHRPVRRAVRQPRRWPGRRRPTSARRSSGSVSCCPGRAGRSTGTSPATSPAQAVAAPATSRWATPSADAGRRGGAAGRLWLDPVPRSLPVVRAGAPWSRAEWVEPRCPVWRELVDPVAARVVDAMGTLARRARCPRRSASPSWPERSPIDRRAAAASAARCSAPRSARRSARSPARWSARPTSACRCADRARRRCCPPTSRPSARASSVPRRRGAALPRAARGRAPAAVRARAVAARRTSRRRRGLRPRHHGRHRAIEEAVGRPRPDATRRRCSRRSTAGCSSRRRRRSSRPRWPGWRPRSRWSRAGSTRSSTPRRPPRLPAAAALRETVRRRRATGGPAEQTFATLVGLELRPRRLREAAALWAALAERGADGRDAVWAHPDLLPTAEDLDDPQAYLHRDEPFDLRGLESAPPPPDPPAPAPEGPEPEGPERGEGDERPDRDG